MQGGVRTETKHIIELHIHYISTILHHLVAREHDVCIIYSYAVAEAHAEVRGENAATVAAGQVCLTTELNKLGFALSKIT